MAAMWLYPTPRVVVARASGRRCRGEASSAAAEEVEAHDGQICTGSHPLAASWRSVCFPSSPYPSPLGAQIWGAGGVLVSYRRQSYTLDG
jgi:hypothetical protein